MSKVGQLTIENDFLKKNTKKFMVSNMTEELVLGDEKLTIKRKCELLGLNRTSFYYKPKRSSDENIKFEELVKSRIDFWHTKQCYLGVRRLVAKLFVEDSIHVGRKLVKKFMDEMGIYAVYPKPNLSKRNKTHKTFPYLLRNKAIIAPNEVWAIDITYIKMGRNHMYLTAIIDWYSRFIVGYELSDTLETAPVFEAVRRAISKYGKPKIINSDQGSQFTSLEYSSYLAESSINQSMDGKARWVDNVIIERWFRSLKYDNIYLNAYETPKALRIGIAGYIDEYNTERPHQSLNYEYPCNVYKVCGISPQSLTSLLKMLYML